LLEARRFDIEVIIKSPLNLLIALLVIKNQLLLFHNSIQQKLNLSVSKSGKIA